MSDTTAKNRFIVELDFNDGIGWIDISSYTMLKELKRQRNIYNKLKPTIDSCSFKIKYNPELINRLLYSGEDIKARVKKVVHYNPDSNGEYNEEVIKSYFTGFVQKNYKMQSSTKVDWISINLIDNNYILDNVLPEELLYKDHYLYNSFNKSKSIIHLILEKAGISNSLTVDATATFGTDILRIDHFKHLEVAPASDNKALSKLPYGGTYQEIITNLLFQYGYTYNFDTDGKFNLFDFDIRDVMETGFGPYFDEINNSNMVGKLVSNKKPPQYEATEITWNKRVYKDRTLLMADVTDGGWNADGSSYCKVSLAANTFYPLSASDTFVPEVYYDVAFEDGETTEDILTTENIEIVDTYNTLQQPDVANPDTVDTTETWNATKTLVTAATTTTENIWGWVEVSSEDVCTGLFGTLGNNIKKAITDSKYQEMTFNGLCCRTKVFICILGGFSWTTKTYDYQIIDSLETAVPAVYQGGYDVTETIVHHDDTPGAVPSTIAIEGNYIEKTFSANPLSFNLRLKNVGGIPLDLEKLEIYGDVILRGADNVAKNYSSGLTDKIFQYTGSYIHEEKHATALANAIYDYYYFSTFEYSCQSTAEYQPGQWVVLTDNNFQSINGYPMANRFCLITERKDIEFTNTHTYKLEEFRAVGLQTTKIYIPHNPILQVKGGGNTSNILANFNLDPYKGSGELKAKGKSIGSRMSKNWIYNSDGYEFFCGESKIERSTNNLYNGSVSSNVSGFGTSILHETPCFIGSGKCIVKPHSSFTESTNHFITQSGISRNKITGTIGTEIYITPCLVGSGSTKASSSSDIEVWIIPYITGSGIVNVFDESYVEVWIIPYITGKGTAKTSSECHYEYGYIADGQGSASLSGESETERYTEMFESVWEIPWNGGYETSGTIQLPLEQFSYLPNGKSYYHNYDFYVNWGDGTEEQHVTSYNHCYSKHTYEHYGTYTIQIYGTIDGFGFTQYGNDNLQMSWLKDITDFGTLFRFHNRGGQLYGTSGLESISAAQAPSLENIDGMNHFFYESGIKSGIENWDTTGVTDMRAMFWGAEYDGDLSGWDTSLVKNMSYTFITSKFNNNSICNWDTSSVTTMKSTFNKALFDQDLSAWNTSNVEDMSSMFKQSEFTGIGISFWDVSKVTRMDKMFFADYAGMERNVIDDITGWDVSSVTNMSYMFWESSFNQDISGWQTDSLTRVSNQFSYSKFNQNLSGWNTSKVYSMGGWFSNSDMDQDYTGLDVSGIDTDTYSGQMFETFSGTNMSPHNMSLLYIWFETLNITDIYFRASNMKHDSTSIEAIKILKSRRWNVIDGGEA